MRRTKHIREPYGRKPIPYDAELYKGMESAVGRFYGWLKSLRRIIIRYERR
ncbi:hypothetical protein KEJ36_00875 [Candidatus Bathyarchaeota archaeon]|nr:hypothetical protein [Candidatus Bathyarchaeota archaeon]